MHPCFCGRHLSPAVPFLPAGTDASPAVYAPVKIHPDKQKHPFLHGMQRKGCKSTYSHGHAGTGTARYVHLRHFPVPFHKDVPYRSPLFPKNPIYSLGSVYRIFQADARHPPSSLIKNQGADTSHHECVVSAPWFSECLISGRCSTETAHMLPGYPPADVSKSRPAVPAASRKKLRQCRR